MWSTTSVLLLLGAYLFGSLPFGLIVGKAARGVDVREHGSGNIGASNVWRTLGPGWGAFTFVLDVLKGLLPVLAAHRVPHASAWLPVLAGLAAIIGHNFSVFLGFKGGKGAATSLGAVFGLSWLGGAIAFGTWAVVLGLFRYISVASMVGTVVCAICLWVLNQKQLPYGVFGALATVFAAVKHRANWRRLRAGTEPKVVLRRPWTRTK